MKILMVIPSFANGGIEKMTQEWCKKLIEKGNECDVLAFSDLGNNPFLKMGCNTYVISISSKKPLQTQKRIRNFFSKHNDYDAVHCHVSQLSGLIAKEFSRISKPEARIVCHAHASKEGKCSSFLSTVVNTILNKYYKKLIKRYSHVNLACSYLAGDLLFGKGNYSFFPNAIDLNKFSFDLNARDKLRNEYNLNDKLVFVHAGRLCKVKNQAFLLEVFAGVASQREDAVLVILGDGELRAELENKTKDLKIFDKVMFLGFKSEVNEFYSMSDVFLLTSFEEALPVCIVEAQANGLFCLASEAVPKEAQLTDRISILSLKESPIVAWVKYAIECDIEISKRFNSWKKVGEKGFEINMSVERLLKLYNQ